MQSDNFISKSYCEFTITSDSVTPEELTEMLRILPSHLFKKGDKSVSKHSGSLITKPYNLWAISSKTLLSEEESISPHLEYLRSQLENKMEVLKNLKDDQNLELTFTVWIETDNSGIGLDLTEQEMSFLAGYSNRVHFSFLTNDEITE
ncbi:DUF4279 domain-containing protein [Sinomicrobium kalidii]|uniref:DUF4279 domain-containing protein n=1 Tax=Sinomicrobium kalidii TaxID=2900738 RepID=UPI001E3BD576|nr:DUF4279 domain-containing protein [Sinomicrobium kalidii]UGU17904.1 DUF4279 domain-containing protein [Sinomicrobium kalidii]